MEVNKMLAANFTSVRENFKSYCDKVNDDCETVIITRKDDKNVVMISLEAYNNLVENMYIMSNKKNYDKLLESKRQVERDEVVEKTAQELEAMEK